MDYILKIIVEKKITFCYLPLMQKHMVPVEDGLLNIKMKQFLLLPLLPVHNKGRSPTLLKDHQRDLSAAPGTPFPFRKQQEERKLKRDDLIPPPRRHLRYDDDEDESNKENVAPPQYPYGPKDEERRKASLGYLLEKWAEDIIWYQEQVLKDLNDLKLKLGIPQ
ncbi:E4 [Gammapapillomavirus 22]|uniref:E4 n=1 Tax=Gammapapillomavirus 22 TaxID=1961679 RepID=A0A2D2AM26_9PAPI|nr:E4 [Gammapapillomavirus 22]